MAPTTFLTLPAELRNEIYELAFTNNTDPDRTAVTDLRDKSPPSNALLLVCRQTYNEVGNLYRETYRNYWAEGHFKLNLCARPFQRRGCKRLLRSLRPVDLAHIQTLHITGFSRLSHAEDKITITRMPGGWCMEAVGVVYIPFFMSAEYEDGEVVMQKKDSAEEVAEAAQDSEEVERHIKSELRFLLTTLIRH